MPAIRAHELTFTYPQRKEKAVDNVSFEIEEGSYTVIAGENGSGKSTLARLLCGLSPLQHGTVEIADGKSLGLVFQSPKNQLVSSIVYRDTSFGPQNLKLPKEEIELRTIECLNITGILDKAQSSTNALSLGQTQKTALAGMLAIWPDILILDEAMSMLDPSSRKNIYEFLRYWHRKGNTIIHITHDMEAVKEAEKVMVMEDGKLTFTGTSDEYLKTEHARKLFTGLESIKKQNKSFSDKTTLTFENVSFAYDDDKNGVKDVSFSLKKGTLTALTGPSGAGKSTILELACGLLVPNSGVIRAGEECASESSVTTTAPVSATAASVTTAASASLPVLAQQNCEAALFESFVADDVAFGPRNLGIKGKELKERVQTAMERAGLPFEAFAERHTFELSGGEKRRVAIAGILAMDSDIVLFDEPAAGLDGPARRKIMQLLRELAEEGKTVLFSTHHEDEAAFADHEIKVSEGRITADAECRYVDEKKEDEGGVREKRPGVNLLAGLRKASVSLSASKPEKKSAIEKFPAAIRILLFLTIFVFSLASRPLWLCALMLGINIVYCLLAGFSLKKLFITALKVLPFLLFFSLFQLIFHPPVEGEILYTTWKYFTISPSKIFLCIRSIIRTDAAIASISAFFVSTPEYDLIDGLKIILTPLSLIKIKVRYFILVLEIIFRFIPLLIDEACSIIKTQIIRGGLGKAKGRMAKIRAVVPLVVPLIIQTIKRSESLADAITMRCFK